MKRGKETHRPRSVELAFIALSTTTKFEYSAVFARGNREQERERVRGEEKDAAFSLEETTRSVYRDKGDKPG